MHKEMPMKIAIFAATLLIMCVAYAGCSDNAPKHVASGGVIVWGDDDIAIEAAVLQQSLSPPFGCSTIGRTAKELKAGLSQVGDARAGQFQRAAGF